MRKFLVGDIRYLLNPGFAGKPCSSAPFSPETLVSIGLKPLLSAQDLKCTTGILPSGGFRRLYLYRSVRKMLPFTIDSEDGMKLI